MGSWPNFTPENCQHLQRWVKAERMQIAERKASRLVSFRQQGEGWGVEMAALRTASSGSEPPCAVPPPC